MGWLVARVGDCRRGSRGEESRLQLGGMGVTTRHAVFASPWDCLSGMSITTPAYDEQDLLEYVEMPEKVPWMVWTAWMGVDMATEIRN